MYVVILHGWGQNRRLWDPIAERLAHFWPTQAWDLPGFGDEPLVSAEWGVAEYADWAEKRLAGIGDDVFVVGHSFGGRVAAEIAARRPTWLRGMVLFGAPCLYRPETSTKLKNIIFHLGKRLVPRSVRGRFMNQELRDAEALGLGDVFRRVVRHDQTALLPKIAVPTLLLWGEQDAEVPVRIAEEMHRLIPGSRLDVLPGAGHNAHIENPVLVYGKIQQFFAHR